MTSRLMIGAAALALLAGCDGFDFDLRGKGGAFSTADAASRATLDRPEPDSRGIISYPSYQVVVARQGDTVATVAERIGLTPGELATYNGVTVDAALRGGEVLALPRRVSDSGPNTITGSPIDVGSIATSAIDRAPGTAGGAVVSTTNSAEPIRHQVARGETAYTIARLYGVSVTALAQWNGLGPDLAVREGSYLIIPVVDASAPAPAVVDAAAPGVGSETPVPPSGEQPLPNETTKPASQAEEKPASPNLGGATSSKLMMPVQGSIIRAYKKGTNDGIDIGAAAGTPVKAAGDGVVAAITKDTQGVPIVVVRHANNVLTVYAGIDGLNVEKGASVKRGQTIGKVRSGNPSFLHFEVREGFNSVDPVPYLG